MKTLTTKQLIRDQIAFPALVAMFREHDTYCWSEDDRVTRISFLPAFPDIGEDALFPAVVVDGMSVSMQRYVIGDVDDQPLQCKQTGNQNGDLVHVGYRKSLLWATSFAYLVGSMNQAESEEVADHILTSVAVSHILPSLGFELQNVSSPGPSIMTNDGKQTLYVNTVQLSGLVPTISTCTIAPCAERPLQNLRVHQNNPPLGRKPDELRLPLRRG